jgi:hypothetical protein
MAFEGGLMLDTRQRDQRSDCGVRSSDFLWAATSGFIHSCLFSAVFMNAAHFRYNPGRDFLLFQKHERCTECAFCTRTIIENKTKKKISGKTY